LLGPVSVALSCKTSTLVYLLALLAALAVCYLIWGSYTRRVTVDGFILPGGEVLRLYAAHVGTVTQRHVSEGELVQKGQRLFSISGERHGGAGPVQEKIPPPCASGCRPLNRAFCAAMSCCGCKPLR
jgi:membrane fusion protein